MKVCHVTSMHQWNDDRIFERACLGLASAGIETVLLSTNDVGENTVKGVRIIGLKERSGLKRRIFSSYEAYKKCLKVDADIYHFHDPDLMPWMFLLALRGRRVIFDIHENYRARVDSAVGNPLLKSLGIRLYSAMEKFFVRNYAGVSVTTNTMGELYKGLGKKVLVTSNVPYIDRLSQIQLEETKDPYPSVYTSGTHSDARNCMQTVEAIPAVAARFPDVKFKFIGRYHPESYKDALLQRARELGVENNIELHGMMPWLENFKRLSKAHIGCVFYEDNLNNRVTIPNRLFEYMYCGIAVIGEKFPEVQRVIETTDCGVAVDSSKPEEIAKGIISLLEDPKLHEKGRNGRKAVVEQYNFEAALKEMIAYYNYIMTVKK